MPIKPILISIVGPTAVGKTAMAISLAKEFQTEILSADSRQFFKELTIGTAKPTADELAEATHHFVNHLSIKEEYNASDFEKEALNFLEGYFKTKVVAIVCGGSGMYVDALLNGFDNHLPSADREVRSELNQRLAEEGIESLQEELKQLDPEFYKEIDLHNSKRLIRAIEICRLSPLPYSELRKGERRERFFETIKIGLEMNRAELYARINQRVDTMIKDGLVAEAQSVYAYKEHNALKTVGYRELFDHFEGQKSLKEAIEKIKVNSRRYAKRQLTWFKKDNEIKWFEADRKKEIIQYLRKRIEPSR